MLEKLPIGNTKLEWRMMSHIMFVFMFDTDEGTWYPYGYIMCLSCSLCYICRSLAHVVDIIRLCKRFSYTFESDVELREQLMNRVTEINTHSLENLAVIAASQPTNNSTAASRWTNVFKRVKQKKW